MAPAIVKVGPNGYIYATVASFNPALSVSSVWRVSPDGHPSSLVFGTGQNDHHTLYVTNFAIMRFKGFKPGAPQPSLVSLPVILPGLDLDQP